MNVFMASAEQRLRLTPAEYRAIEMVSERRHDFFDGEIFSMGGGSYWHNLGKDNLAHAIRNRLADRKCTVLTSDQREKVDATGLSTSPDAVVFCGQSVFEDGVLYAATTLRVPADSTERYRRQSAAAGGSWILAAVTDLAGTVEIESLGASVPVADVDANVEFPPAPSQAESPHAGSRLG